MRSTLVGIHDGAAGNPVSRLRARVAEAVDGPAVLAGSGPLMAAWKGETDGRRDPSRPIAVLEGRIYNLPEIARELGLDPRMELEQVVLEGASRWGLELPERLRGDFVLLVWRPASQSGFLARDHLGVRAVFLAERSGRLHFATELRPLLALFPAYPGVDRDSISRWLTAGTPGQGLTLLDGVRRLPPAHLIAFDRDGWRTHRYWRAAYRPPLRAPREELVARTRKQFERAVARRCQPGESLAVLLSGGLDSTSIAAMAHTLPPDRRPLTGYSGVFPDHASVDEASTIGAFAQHLGLRSTRIVVRGGSQIIGALRHTAHWRSPLMGPNAFWDQPLLNRAAEDGAKVLLDGEGGDEAYGVRRYLLSDLVRRGRILAAARAVRRMPGAGDDLPWRNVRWMIQNTGAVGALPAGLHDARRRRRGAEFWAPAWLTEDAARRAFELDDTWAWKRHRGPRWWAYQMDIFTDLIDGLGLLDHVRRRAERVGLEPRHPFLDVDLIEEAMRLPPPLTFDPWFDRPLFRDAVRDIMPREVVERPTKAAFNDINRTALLNDRPALERLLGPDAMVAEYVRHEILGRDVLSFEPYAHPHGPMAWADDVWRLATLEIWLRSEADPGFCERAEEELPLSGTRHELVA